MKKLKQIISTNQIKICHAVDLQAACGFERRPEYPFSKPYAKNLIEINAAAPLQLSRRQSCGRQAYGFKVLVRRNFLLK